MYIPMIFGNIVSICFLNQTKIKKVYIKNIKNGVQYTYIKEIVSYDRMLNQDNSIVNESIGVQSSGS